MCFFWVRREHVRYPKDIFSIQTAVYATYHMQDTQTFHNKEDQWEIPVMGGNGAQAQEHFERAMKAQRDNDWALYGEEMKKLGDVIRQMNK